VPKWDGKRFVSLGTADIGAYASTGRTAAVSGMRADRVQSPPYGASPRGERVSYWDGSAGSSHAARSHLAVPTVAPTAMGALMAVQERIGQVDDSAGDHVAQVLAALLERLARKSRASDALPEAMRISRSI